MAAIVSHSNASLNTHTVHVQPKNETEPIQQLFKILDSELREDPHGKNVQKILKEYLDNYDDWKNYMRFNEIKYARNLVNANDMLELIVICWLPHQVTPIHNHAVSVCISFGNLFGSHINFNF
jgi:predicted metal-dependent enzyme (double-stranded beta helix superfamily)